MTAQSFLGQPPTPAIGEATNLWVDELTGNVYIRDAFSTTWVLIGQIVNGTFVISSTQVPRVPSIVAGNITIQPNDGIIYVNNTTAAPVTVTPGPILLEGQLVKIKDYSLTAGSFPIIFNGTLDVDNVNPNLVDIKAATRSIQYARGAWQDMGT